MQVTHPSPLDPAAGRHDAPAPADLTRLAALIQTYAPHDGPHALRVPGVTAVKASRVNTELFHGVYRPSLCIVAQGAKRVFLGSDMYGYDESLMLVVSLDLPVASQVTRASVAQPFLSVKIDLDPHRIAAMALRVYPHGLPPVPEPRGVNVGPIQPGIVNAALRLLELLADDRDVELLAPLVLEELLIRLLRSPVGRRVAHIGQAESSVQRIASAVEWVRAHFDEKIRVEELAESVHMSPSSFHQHFKAVTTLSPLQFQKALRLREARRLMLTSRMDAATAGRQVGYVSASQFSREYGRLFGHAPSRDISRLRGQEAAQGLN